MRPNGRCCALYFNTTHLETLNMNIELAPKATNTMTVTYAGQDVEVPANTQYVGLAHLHLGVQARTILVAWPAEPAWLGTNYSLADVTIITEVKGVSSIKDTLRKVGDLTNEEIILSNAEELAYKTMNLLAEDLSPEEMIHELYCPSHGIHTEFTAHQQPTVEEYVAKLAKASEPAPAPQSAPSKKPHVVAPAEPKVGQATPKAASPLTPQEVAQLLAYAIARGYKPS